MSETRTIATKCPMCQAILPIFDVSFHIVGRWRPKVSIVVSGDATDYVAHMWQHSQEQTWP